MIYTVLFLLLGCAMYVHSKKWMGLSFDPDDFVCHEYPYFCHNFLQEIGCQNMTITGCPNYPGTSGDLPNFVGKCVCNDPDLYYDASSNRISQELVSNRVGKDVKWMLEPWSTGPPYDIERTYGDVCSTVLERLGCPEGDRMIKNSGTPVMSGSTKVAQFSCTCGSFTAASSTVNSMIIDAMNAYHLDTTPVFSNPVYLSVPLSLAIVFIVGKLGAIIAVYLKLPPIIGFLLAGYAIQNCISPMFLKGAGYPFPSPADEMKRVALIIVLMRAGLAIKFDEIKKNLFPTIMLCLVPLLGEFFFIMFLCQPLLPGWSLTDMGLLASVMAPLGPSVVISAMLGYSSNKKKTYGYPVQQTMITAPIEAVIAIVLFNIFANLAQTESPPLFPWVEVLPLWLNCVLIPVNLTFSTVMGILVGYVVSKYIHYRVKIKTDYVWLRVNKNPQMGSSTADLVFVFLVMCYTMMSLATQQYIQQCSGVLIVFACAISVSVNCPSEVAYDMAASLKGIWVFAEVVLFTCTGTSLTFDNSNGPLYGQRGLSPEAMREVLAIIFIGLAGRFIALGFSMAALYPTLPEHRQNFMKWVGPFWLNNFIYQLPKATVQATMGGVAYATRIIPGPQGLNKGMFIMQATAFTVLICAPIGAILTKAIGGPLSLYISSVDKEAGWRIAESRYSRASKYYKPLPGDSRDRVDTIEGAAATGAKTVEMTATATGNGHTAAGAPENASDEDNDDDDEEVNVSINGEPLQDEHTVDQDLERLRSGTMQLVRRMSMNMGSVGRSGGESGGQSPASPSAMGSGSAESPTKYSSVLAAAPTGDAEV